MPLVEYSQLASLILINNTKYQKDRELIENVFLSNLAGSSKVVLRLALIDGFYSTQMSKRLWGLEDIADAVNEISEDDNEIRALAVDFLENPAPNNIIFQYLICRDYGIRKDGTSFGKASSLVTKYLYFLTRFQFPIYDNLVRKSYEFISNEYHDLPQLTNRCDIDFFKNIKRMNEVTNINNYEILDNFLWLYGKVTRGSFSLIVQKDKYLSLMKLATRLAPGMKDRDSAIRMLLGNLHQNRNQVNEILGNDLTNFCAFCYGQIN